MAGPAHGTVEGLRVDHHFENADQQFQAANLGMWVFLATEILFFGGLFCAYAVYRANHPEIFLFAHHFLDKNLGAVNTVVLICSSFTMAWAVRAAQLRQQGMIKLMLALTLLCAFGFLGIKYLEYSHKWQHGLLWAGAYNPAVAHGEPGGEAVQDAAAVDAAAARAVDAIPPAAPATPDRAAPAGVVVERSAIAPAATGPAGLADPGAAAPPAIVPEPANARVFFSIYFMMTGLHGVHVLGGMGAMLWLFACVRRGDFLTGPYTKVHMVGLYWHLVDLIWIYLFLLLYLIH